MFPELFKVGPITLKTYGFFVAIAFLVGMHYVKQRAKNRSIPPEVILDLSLWILVSGLVGARILYVVLNWEFYKNNLLEVFHIWSGGLVFYGGVLFGFIISVLYAINKKLKLWLLADILAPGIFLGVAIARIGCLSAGCCYGKPTNLPWGIKFTNPLSLVPESALGLKLHPTQIYESVFCFLLFIVLHFLSKPTHTVLKNGTFLDVGTNLRFEKRGFLGCGGIRQEPSQRLRRVDGEIFFISMITYSIWRFFIEFLRWDDRGAKIFGLFPSQFIAIIIVVVSLTFLSRKSDESGNHIFAR